MCVCVYIYICIMHVYIYMYTYVYRDMIERNVCCVLFFLVPLGVSFDDRVGRRKDRGNITYIS